MSLFPHGEWGSPTIKNYTVPAMPRRIGVVGASPMVEDETGALVNAALIATENPSMDGFMSYIFNFLFFQLHYL